jgi:hypothetical protein
VAGDLLCILAGLELKLGAGETSGIAVEGTTWSMTDLHQCEAEFWLLISEKITD